MFVSWFWGWIEITEPSLIQVLTLLEEEPITITSMIKKTITKIVAEIEAMIEIEEELELPEEFEEEL